MASYLAHLELEEAPLLFHLFGDLSPTYFSTYHPVELGVLLFLLFYFGSAGEKNQAKRTCLGTAIHTGQAWVTQGLAKPFRNRTAS